MAATLQRKSSGEHIFVIVKKFIYKEHVLGSVFNSLGQDGTL